MTAQTISYLKSNEFTLTGAAARIGAQNMVDLIDTAAARTPIINVMFPEYGALNSGTSHPLSGITLFQGQNTTGWSLAQWQTIFSFATATTNELDWCAHQLAINTADNFGGTVISPSGPGYIMSNSSSASDGSGQVTFPTTSTFYFHNGVSWHGDFPGTVLNWPSDLGSGKGAILCAGRASGSCGGVFFGLVLIGPGVGATLNATTSNMSGIMTNDRRSIIQTSIVGFRVGIDLVGGQCLHQDIDVSNCYYGYYWNTKNTNNYGNMTFLRVSVNTCNKACIGVIHSVAVLGSTFMSCGFSTSPYSIFKETNSGSPGDSSAVTECQFINTQFEAIGNALICDDQATQGARVVSVTRSELIQAEFTWNSGFKIAAVSNFSVIDIHSVSDFFRIVDPVFPGGWTPGTASMFFCDFPGSFFLKGNVNDLMANCVTAVKPMFAGAAMAVPGGGGCVRVENSQAIMWSGTLCFNTDTTAVVGSVVTCGTSNFNCQASAGTTADAVVGVMKYNPTPGTAFSTCIIADGGFVTVKASGTVAVGNLIRTHSGGLGMAASNSNDTATSPIFAIALGASTGTTFLAKLRGLS